MRLVRCDRCKADLKLGEQSYSGIAIPVLNREEISGDETNLDLCFTCLKALWAWIHEGQVAANTATRRTNG